MRLFYSVLVASVAFAGAAFAAGNDNLFGNTVVITSATGVTKAMVNADNTYETHLADGSVVKGTWLLMAPTHATHRQSRHRPPKPNPSAHRMKPALWATNGQPRVPMVRT